LNGGPFRGVSDLFTTLDGALCRDLFTAAPSGFAGRNRVGAGRRRRLPPSRIRSGIAPARGRLRRLVEHVRTRYRRGRSGQPDENLLPAPAALLEDRGGRRRRLRRVGRRLVDPWIALEEAAVTALLAWVFGGREAVIRQSGSLSCGVPVIRSIKPAKREE
jgi:hypothetical protein